MESPAKDPLIGQQVGPCRVEALIGRGGMGTVYKARHLTLDRPMALKVLARSVHMGEAAAALLLREARAAAALDDPRIVRVYDAGAQDGVTWVAMELVDGQTLEALIRFFGPAHQAEALQLVKEAALALSVAHKAGLVHRDVKPANILRTASGAVKLADFGLAAPAGDAKLAETGLAGSFDFMAPEQPFTAAADPRLDLYALGCTWYYLLTGKPPYSGSTPGEVLVQHRESPVPDVREQARDVVPAAAALIARLMDKLPEKRPANAGELLKLLENPDLLPPEVLGGSPFKILPPPVEAKVGLAAEHEAQGLAPQAPPPMVNPTPSPPPPIYHGEASPWPGRLIVLGLWAVFSARTWISVIPADRVAAGFFAGAGATLLILTGLRGRGRAVLSLLWAAMAGSFAWAMSASGMPAFEVLVVAGLGLALSLGGLYLGLSGSIDDDGLGAALLAAGCLALTAAAALPAGAGLGDAAQSLGRLLAELNASQGARRWSGAAALVFAWAVARYTRWDSSEWARKKSSTGRILNWNK